MDGIAARDPRVEEILTRPDEYFARARRQAWLKAGEEVAADLERRARRGNAQRHRPRRPTSTKQG